MVTITERTTRDEIRTVERFELLKTMKDLTSQEFRSGPVKDTIMAMCYIELTRRDGKDPRPMLEKSGMVNAPWVQEWLS
jgi:hypothetical protein